MTNKVKEEIGYFIGAAFAVTALTFLFFRNLLVMGVSMVVVGIGVVWSIGSLVLLDYELNLMTSLIPPLMIVIGVPNCIYLVNKYHAEYKRHGIKAMALQRMIVKVGNATLLTNFTTALGFATFIFTHSQMLKQFGVVTALNILGMFVISIVVIPALMAGLPAPKTEHTRHLDRRWMFTVVIKPGTVEGHRARLHRCSPGFAVQLYGHRANADHWQHRGRHSRPRPGDSGFVVEAQFEGPCRSMWWTPSPRGCHQHSALGPLAKRLGRLPRIQPFGECGRCDEVCLPGIQKRPPEKLPTPRTGMEKTQFGPWLRGSATAGRFGNGEGVAGSFFDSTRAVTRVSVQMADVGTLEMRELLNEVRPRVDSIFPPEKYGLIMTGTSVTFLEGTTYMVTNLGISIALAICVIALMMASLFKSSRMVAIALVPNLFPLLFTAGVMGWFGIAIKPSTVLVFSIALAFRWMTPFAS